MISNAERHSRLYSIFVEQITCIMVREMLPSAARDQFVTKPPIDNAVKTSTKYNIYSTWLLFPSIRRSAALRQHWRMFQPIVTKIYIHPPISPSAGQVTVGTL